MAREHEKPDYLIVKFTPDGKIIPFTPEERRLRSLSAREAIRVLSEIRTPPGEPEASLDDKDT